MCIRDRGYVLPKSMSDLLLDYQESAVRTLSRRIVRRGGTCLLYTSDAADERSSVDLGGRRIIKKKNRTTHTDHETVHRIDNTTHNVME